MKYYKVDVTQWLRQQAAAADWEKRAYLKAIELGADPVMLEHGMIGFTGTPAEQQAKAAKFLAAVWATNPTEGPCASA